MSTTEGGVVDLSRPLQYPYQQSVPERANRLLLQFELRIGQKNAFRRSVLCCPLVYLQGQGLYLMRILWTDNLGCPLFADVLIVFSGVRFRARCVERPIKMGVYEQTLGEFRAIHCAVFLVGGVCGACEISSE